MSVNVRERVEGLIARVEQGRLLEAFEEFYAEDVVMQENANPPTVGKAANREREKAFVASVAAVHESRANAILVDGDRAVIEWVADFTNTEGTRLRIEQTALQTWLGGQIAHERFYYDSASVVRPMG
jgi:ketosteroid isomerase-like protein